MLIRYYVTNHYFQGNQVMDISLKKGRSIEYKVRACFLFDIFNTELRCLCVMFLNSLRESQIFAQVEKRSLYE